ncbi:hypothetical protein BH20BAC1_BH20BAC1_23450 [soil metagenome]
MVLKNDFVLKYSLIKSVNLSMLTFPFASLSILILGYNRYSISSYLSQELCPCFFKNLP